jgi:Tol biopolymer transport system component
VAPTFSPDGTQIAYVDWRGEDQDKHRVWVVNADGSDPHVIVAEATLNHAAVSGLAWSPTGDAIALGLLRTDARGHVTEASVFTFAPDGSRFTRVIENGVSPTWSPDGSRIAFLRYRRGDLDPRGVIGIVNADGTGLEYVPANAGPGVWHPGP